MSKLKKKSAEVIDFRNAFLEYNLKFNVQNVDKGILTNDRVHLNDAGNKLVADMIWHHLME
ncbi:MAG: hypothetical protein U0T36_05480 [Saprospiraceae bacterium]